MLGLLLAAAPLSAAPVPLINPAFEEPGSGRISGGFDAVDVAGWNDTAGVFTNSGVEQALLPGSAGGYVNTSGYVAFLKGSDGGAYQVTAQPMAGGQVYRLSWKAGSTLGLAGTTSQRVRLFKTSDNGNTRTPLATSTGVLNGTNKVFETYVLEYTANAADGGAFIGIELENTSPTANIIGFDDFNLEMNPTEPAPATGLPVLTWDDGATDDGTATFSATTAIEREYHFLLVNQANSSGAWRGVLRVAAGNADIYVSPSSWPTTASSTYKSSRLTGDDGFVGNQSNYTPGQTWRVTVRATEGTTFTLFCGNAHVQDLGALGFTDGNGNGRYDIGESISGTLTGDVVIKPEGIRFFKTTVPAGIPAWSLWLNGDTRDILIRKNLVPFSSTFDRKQAGQLLVVPNALAATETIYYTAVTGAPGDVVNLDSRIQKVDDIPLDSTTSNIGVTGAPYRVYRTTVPIDQIAWDVSTTANSGDPNICVRKDSVPCETENSGFSETPGSAADSVTLVPNFLTNGTWFITVYGTGSYDFTLKSGNPVIRPLAFADTQPNDRPNRAGGTFYCISDINSQVGALGWELLLSNQLPGTRLSLRRNKVPGCWQYRSGGSTFVSDTADQYTDYSGTGGFLQRQAHQADIWYVGVFTKQAPAGGYILDSHPIMPAAKAFESLSVPVAGQEPGQWKFIKVEVPVLSGTQSWELRLNDVTGGLPEMMVRRDLLPLPGSTGSWANPQRELAWPSGNAWAAPGVDWTGRADLGSSIDFGPFRRFRLLMSAGRPLQAGVYYVGVYNAGTTATSYTLEGRIVGEDKAVPVNQLSFGNGSTATITGLAPREAVYYKVSVSPNTPSWEITLDPSVGEMTMMVRRGYIPALGGALGTQSADASGKDMQYQVRKTGSERLLILPSENQDYLVPGDYYIAVIAEGQNPPDESHIGSGNCSGIITSRGSPAVPFLGTASTTAITQAISLDSGQCKAFTVTVPAGTSNLELRLDNRVGNPNINLLAGTRIPGSANSYGSDGGQSGAVTKDAILSVVSPVAGTYTVLVRAAPTTAIPRTFPAASANLVITATAPLAVNFNGGTSAVTGHLGNAWRYFKVIVPAGMAGWDLRLKAVTGTPLLVVRRDELPAVNYTTPWSNPSEQASWASGNAWVASDEWTQREYEPGGVTSVRGRRLVMAMGQPLEPGTYYVGVYNSSATVAVAYTLESRGIGTGQMIPVNTLAYTSGSSAVVENLVPREAAYFKVTVPTDVPSWELTMAPSAGEMMMIARRGAIPDFSASSSSNGIQSELGDRAARVQKTGAERLVLMPANGQSALVAGDYYLAVVSEGVSPSPGVIGTGTSSATLANNGPLAITPLGEASSVPLTQAVSLVHGQLKAYSFILPVGTISYEVRLNNRNGSPWMHLVGGSRLPKAWISPSADYGSDGGQSTGSLRHTELISGNNPAAGIHTIVVSAATASGGGTLSISAVTAPITVAVDGGTATVTGQAANSWRYFQFTVPATPGLLAWDLRVKDAVGGTLKLMVRRGELPTTTVSSWLPSRETQWPIGNSWMGGIDWTNRYANPSSVGSMENRRLVMAMGRPLEPGVYYAGVYNDISTPATYTLESRAIGAGHAIQVNALSYDGGSAAINNLTPREAAYFKVSIPAGTPSWELALEPTNGEMLMAMRRGYIPDFLSTQGVQAPDENGNDLGRNFVKIGPERAVLLPPNGQQFVVPGDYYIAVVSEGQTDGSTPHQIGGGSSSGTLTSLGAFPISPLGSLTTAGVTQAISLAARQIKGYSFTIPPDAQIVSLRLDNKVGVPWMTLRHGMGLPKPVKGAGIDGGQEGDNLDEGGALTLTNPAPGTYQLMVAAADNYPYAGYADASVNLVIRLDSFIPLNFSASENSNGRSHTDTRTLAAGERAIYQINVPEAIGNQPVIGWMIRSGLTQGNASITLEREDGTTIPLTSRNSVITPPLLVPGEIWKISVEGIGATHYSITSEPITLRDSPWAMPLGFNQTFGDSGAMLAGDKGTDLATEDWHFYAIDVPEGNSGLLRTELQAISGNPNLYIREDGVPTTDHVTGGGSSLPLFTRSLVSTGSEYGNWVPVNGRAETQLRPGRWYLGVKAIGSISRYRLIVSNGNVTDLALNDGSVANQPVVGRDWRHYRFTVPMDAPVNWNLTFTEQSGDVSMTLRDIVPPGSQAMGLDTVSWTSDAKNQGPYSPFEGQGAPGLHTYSTPPLRPGHTYYVGIRANNDAVFSLSSAVGGGTIGISPVLDFYHGTLAVSVPANSSVVYQIPVPGEATRLKWTSVVPSTVQLRLEQGTIPGLSGTQHYTGSGNFSSINRELGASWPWVPGQIYYLRIVNSAASAADVTLTMNGKNEAIDDDDLDGLPDAWEKRSFGETISEGPMDDADDDGVVNLLECAFNVSPTGDRHPLLLSSQGTAGMPLVSYAGAGVSSRLRVEYVRLKSGLSYAVEVSSNLSGGAGEWTEATGIPVVTPINSQWERVVVEDTAGVGAPRRFARIRVTGIR